MEFVRKFDIGHIVSTIAAAITLLTLSFQIRSTYVSEKEMTLKVEEVALLAAKLEEQNNVIEKQNDELFELAMSRLKAEQKIYQSQSSHTKMLLDNIETNEKVTFSYISSIMFTNSVTSAYLKAIYQYKKDIDFEMLDKLQEVNALSYGLIALQEEWRVEKELINKQYEPQIEEFQHETLRVEETFEKLEELYRHRTNELMVIKGRFIEKSDPIKLEISEKQDKLNKLINELVSSYKGKS